MEHALAAANERLLKKQKQNQGSTMESVKTFILNKDYDKAREIGRCLVKTGKISEVVDIFKAIPAEKKLCGCGNLLPVMFNYFTLDYFYKRVCDNCVEKEKLSITERQEESKRLRAIEMADRLRVFELTKGDVVGKMLIDYGVPCRMAGARLTEPKIKQGSYFFTGAVGTGKTHNAVALMADYIDNIEPICHDDYVLIPVISAPMFVTVPELLLDIRSCFDEKSDVVEKELIYKYAETPFLILDDMGVEKVSDWSLQTLYIIINRRYDNPNNITIITSNLTLNEISKKFNDRIGSRINGMCKTLSFKGKDRRMKN